VGEHPPRHRLPRRRPAGPVVSRRVLRAAGVRRRPPRRRAVVDAPPRAPRRSIRGHLRGAACATAATTSQPSELAATGVAGVVHARPWALALWRPSRIARCRRSPDAGRRGSSTTTPLGCSGRARRAAPAKRQKLRARVARHARASVTSSPIRGPGPAGAATGDPAGSERSRMIPRVRRPAVVESPLERLAARELGRYGKRSRSSGLRRIGDSLGDRCPYQVHREHPVPPRLARCGARTSRRRLVRQLEQRQAVSAGAEARLAGMTAIAGARRPSRAPMRRWPMGPRLADASPAGGGRHRARQCGALAGGRRSPPRRASEGWRRDPRSRCLASVRARPASPPWSDRSPRLAAATPRSRAARVVPGCPSASARSARDAARVHAVEPAAPRVGRAGRAALAPGGRPAAATACSTARGAACPAARAADSRTDGPLSLIKQLGSGGMGDGVARATKGRQPQVPS